MKRKLYLGFCALMVSAAINTEAAEGTSFMTEGQNLDGFYEIDEYQDLVDLSVNSTYWGAKFIQTMNIDAMNNSFTPIASFSGEYNGSGFEIQNLSINSTGDFVGLFGINSGDLSGVKLVDCSIKGNNFTGGLVGYNSGVISSSLVSGTIEGSNFVGGLIGYTKRGTINACKGSGTIIGVRDVGGLVGRAERSTIRNTYSDALVVGNMYVGGLVGLINTSNIDNSYSFGGYGSGLVGFEYGTNTITEGYWEVVNSLANLILGVVAEERPFFMLMQQNVPSWPWASTTNPGSETYPWIPNPGGYPYLFFEDPQPTLYAVWTGETSEDWATTSNWRGNTLPTETSDVLISPFADYKPKIVPDQKVTIKSLWVPEDTQLTLSSNGEYTKSPSLIISESVISHDNVMFDRDLSNGVAHYISSPLMIPNEYPYVIPYAEFLPLQSEQYGDGGWDLFFAMRDPLWVDLLHGDDPANFENQYIAFTDSTFENGVGYYYYKHDYSAPQGGNTIAFMGNPTVGVVEVTTLKRQNSTHPHHGVDDCGGTGYNMLGNPYTSSIAINSDANYTNNFIDQNDDNFDEIAKAVYIWNPELGGLEVISNNGFSVDPRPDAFQGTPASSGYIMPAQGFIVKAKEDGTVFTFDPSIRNHFDNTAKYYKTSEVSASWSGVQVKLTNENGYMTSTNIGVNDITTSGLDVGYDVACLQSNKFGFEENINQIYSKIIGSNAAFAVQGIPTSQEKVDLGVNITSKGSGYYTFNVYKEGIKAVSIEDTETGKIYNVEDTGFEVYLEGGVDYTDRFVLHLTKASLDEAVVDASIMCIDNELIFDNVSGTYQIFDLSGKLVKSGTAENQKLNLQKGNYIINSNGIVEKISIK